jgi:hypothetical protein
MAWPKWSRLAAIFSARRIVRSLRTVATWLVLVRLLQATGAFIIAAVNGALAVYVVDKDLGVTEELVALELLVSTDSSCPLS